MKSGQSQASWGAPTLKSSERHRYGGLETWLLGYNVFKCLFTKVTWWRHQMETFPRHWPFVQGIHRSPVISLHTDQWRGTLMFSLRLTQQLSKQWRSRWFKTPSRALWRHCNHLPPWLRAVPEAGAICILPQSEQVSTFSAGLGTDLGCHWWLFEKDRTTTKRKCHDPVFSTAKLRPVCIDG